MSSEFYERKASAVERRAERLEAARHPAFMLDAIRRAEDAFVPDAGPAFRDFARRFCYDWLREDDTRALSCSRRMFTRALAAEVESLVEELLAKRAAAPGKK